MAAVSTHAPRIEHTESHSSNIHSFAYDPEAETLTVRFRNGGAYEYAGFPAPEHDSFRRAASHGKHFHAHIKGKYPTKKIA